MINSVYTLPVFLLDALLFRDQSCRCTQHEPRLRKMLNIIQESEIFVFYKKKSFRVNVLTNTHTDIIRMIYHKIK